MINRCIDFKLHPLRTNSVASQSSSSGWEGGTPISTEIGWTGYDASAEVMHPNPVDHHPGGKRVVGLDEPPRESQAAVRWRPPAESVAL